MLKPLRLGVSTSSFVHMMPREIMRVMMENSRTGTPRHLDGPLNELMADYTREIMQAINALDIDSMECYHSTVWDGWQLVGVMTENPRVEFWSAHASYGSWIDPSSPVDSVREAAVKAYCSSVDMAAEMGAGIVVAHPGTHASYSVPRSVRLELSVEALRAIADHARQRGVRLAVEPLPKDEPGGSLDEVLWMIEAIGRENVGVNFDVNHVFPAADVPGLIRQAGARILSVHVSDQDNQERHWLPFDGILDWREVLAALVDIGYQGPLIYETHVRGANSCLEIGEIILDNYLRLMQLAP